MFNLLRTAATASNKSHNKAPKAPYVPRHVREDVLPVEQYGVYDWMKSKR